MTRKIFCSGFLVTAIVLPLCLLIASLSLYEYFDGAQREQLRDALRLAAIATTHDGEDFLHEARSDRYRLTWIAADGSVLYDTETGAATLENHADREEIRQALETGEGESVRDSATLLQKTRYIACRLSDGTVLRIAADHASVWRLLLRLLAPTLAVAVLVLVLSAVLASRLARRIVAPINALDLEHPLDNDTYEELSPLLERIDRQRGEIDRRLADLRRRRDEFAQITASMNEALVLLDKNDRILSLNPAAQRLFDAAQVAPGTGFILLDRSHELTQALATQELVANPSSYEVELRLIRQGAQVRLAVKLYTRRDERFAYRKKALPASIHPATAAGLMVLAAPWLKDGATVADPCCGSGTLLIERAQRTACRRIGIDISRQAIEAAKENFQAAGLSGSFLQCDCLRWRPKQPVDEILSNLPFGNRVGTHESNQRLYAGFIKKLPDWLKPGGVAVLYTMEIRLLRQCLEDCKALEVRRIVRTEAGGLTPAIFILQKKGGQSL